LPPSNPQAVTLTRQRRINKMVVFMGASFRIRIKITVGEGKVAGPLYL
jgi:hypothetical protein